MGKIRKIRESELVGGTQTIEVYPITSCAAVYRSDNKRLDVILNRNLPLNVSTLNSSADAQQSLTLEQALALIPEDLRTLGQIITYMTNSTYYVKQYNGTSLAEYMNTTHWKDFAGGGATMKVIQLANEEEFHRIENPDPNTFYCW